MSGLQKMTAWILVCLPTLLVAQTDYTSHSQESDYANVWTAWSDWSTCTATCALGVKVRYRECVGQHRGRVIRLKPHEWTCTGPNKDFITCRVGICPPDAKDTREYQCSLRDREVVLGNSYQWQPFHGGTNPCELQCLARGYSFLYNFGPVTDGTPCTKSEDQLCAAGQCLGVGCDGKVGSEAKFDKCHLCGERHDACVHIKRHFRRAQPELGNFGYTEIAKIPLGASYLSINESSGNYLALADSRGAFIINGNWLIDWPGKYEVAGTLIDYRRQGANESITADGPSREDLFLNLVFREENPGVYYEYWIPAVQVSGIEEYERSLGFYDDDSTASPNDKANPLEIQQGDHHQKLPQDDAFQAATGAAPHVFAGGSSDSTFGKSKVDASSIPDRHHKNKHTYNQYVGQSRAVNDVAEPNLSSKMSKSMKTKERERTRRKNSRTSKKNSIKAEKKSRQNDGANQCGKCAKVKNRARSYCRSDFVIRGLIMDLHLTRNATRYEVRIIETYRTTTQLLTYEFVWVPGGCRCPKFIWNKEYVMMGHLVVDQKTMHSKLVVNSTDYVRPYSKSLAVRMGRIREKVCT